MSVGRRKLVPVLAIVSLVLAAPNVARGFSIDFDTDASGSPISAPCVFANATALRDLYASLGVHFLGPAADDGGAILDDCGNFGVNALSGSNFLAFNTGASLSDGGVPRGPQTIGFDYAVSAASIWAAGGYYPDASFELAAYNAAGSLVDMALTSGQSWSQLSVSGPGITSLVVTQTSSDYAWVYDDLSYVPEAPVPEPCTLLLLAGGLASLGVVRRRRTT